MEDFDWKALVRNVAPILGTALGGPLAGAAVKVLGEALLGDSSASMDDVERAVMAGISPESIAKLKEMENAFKIQMRSLEIDLEKLNQETVRAYIADTQSARTANSGNRGVFVLGVTILCTFAAMVVGVMVGSYNLLIGAIIVKDPGTVAIVSGMIGSLVGYSAGHAQQVIGFFFGSSKGSADKTEAMTRSMTEAMTKLGDRK
jgi:hypothetical protein